jgi:hypothetical protein
LERKKPNITICRWYDNIYKWPKNSTRGLLNLIKSFSDLVGYKINSNKSVAFLSQRINRVRKKYGNNTLHNSHK